MSGIYIHVPFCKKKCAYCDFYKVVSTKNLPEFIEALLHEIKLRVNYLPQKKISTVYFGGGTPSILSAAQINRIFFELQNFFEIQQDAEITFEANPDDLTQNYIEQLRQTPINRISLGIQSFRDDDLKLMNRRHTAQEARQAVRLLQSAGYENISGDLIYGLPHQTGEKWLLNLEEFFRLNIQHLSAYHLTYEQDTKFHKLLKSGKIEDKSDIESEEFYTTLLDLAHTNGFEQYEISNFAKPGLHSRHNSSYWANTPYLGLGPSAHSFNGNSRQWTSPDLESYISCSNSETIIPEIEFLTEPDFYNEFIMKNLRTVLGVNKHLLEQTFDKKYTSLFYKIVSRYEQSEHLVNSEKSVSLTRKGMFISDRIISDLFYV